MLIDSTCPWVSVFPSNEIQNLQEEHQVVALTKLLVRITLEAIDIYERGEFSKLDALVGNYGCESHTFNILSLELTDECQSLRATCAKIMECMEGRRFIKGKARNLEGFKTQLETMCSISERMKYLIQSRLLTITKTTSYDDSKFATREYEVLKTDCSKLARGLNPKVEQLLKPIVSLVQINMSESSILFMRNRLNELALSDELLLKMMAEDNICRYNSKAFSCCYYNTKALLHLIAEMKAPLIVKKMTKVNEPALEFAFKSTGVFGQFELMTEDCPPNTPSVTCVGYFPDDLSPEEWLEKVHQYGLGNLILASGAQGPMYVPSRQNYFPIPLKEAEEEILGQIEKAKELECVFMDHSIFDVDHFYCSGGKNDST